MSQSTGTSEIPHAEEFRQWLKERTDLGDRAVTDVVSRARRASRMVDLQAPRSDPELRFRLDDSAGFGDLSPSVRSQLKRAAVLYRTFWNQRVRTRHS